MDMKPQGSRGRKQATTRNWEVGYSILNRYEILDIRPGGMGIVYIVGDHEWNQMFAIKTFQDRFLWDSDVIDRFTKEAETWVNLERHTNIVFANFVQQIEGKPCIFLEYINGGDLSQYIGKLDIAHAIDFAIQLCNGMDYACKRLGVIHRDIKPQNLLITSDGVLKVTDFGLVKAVGQMVLEEELDREVPLVSCGMGTWPYMSPEQFPERIQKQYRLPLAEVTNRSDIYSFGVTLYQVLTGRLPFSGIEQVFTQYAASPASLNPKVPKQLELLLLKCMERNPCDRQKSFADLLVDLVAIYNALPSKEKAFGERYVVKGCKELFTVGDWNNRGVALNELRKHQDAISCFDRALELDPRYAIAWSNKGMVLEALGGHLDAIACCERAIELDPLFVEAWTNKGATLKALGKHPEAIVCYDNALELNPRYVLAWSNKGAVLCEMGRNQEAIACCEKALELNPRDAVAWHNKGLILLNLGRQQEAIACYDRALDINPKLDGSWNDKGAVLKSLGRHEEEIACYDQAIELNPELVVAWGNKGNALEVLGRYQEAIACFNRVLELNPRQDEVWGKKGKALGKLGRHQEKIYCYDKALELDPGNGVAWYNKGNALRILGRQQEAIACYDRALELNECNYNALSNKGNALEALGRHEEAIACYDRVLAMNPKHDMAWYNKGVALGVLGKHEEVIACCDRALELNERLYEALYNKGVALEALGRNQEAIACFRKFIELAPPEHASLVRRAEENIRKLSV